MRLRRGVSLFVCTMFIFSILVTYTSVNLITFADSNLNTFPDHTIEKYIVIPKENSFNLELPLTADVISATLNLTLENYNGNLPFNPELHINSKDNDLSRSIWRFQRTGYGVLGSQETFKTGQNQSEYIFGTPQDVDELKIYLPGNAKVHSAKFNLTGIEYDYWSKNVISLNQEPDNAGDYEPDMEIFDDKLLTVYRSYNDEVTNGSDSDIVITSSTNGLNWSTNLEVSSKPDSLPPYNDTFKSADWRPTITTFNNKIFCAWESNSTDTSDSDYDILLCSSSDGINWGPIINLSDQWENDYSYNPGFKNDWTVDLVSYQDKLWMIWATNNTDTRTGYSSPIGDIIITSSLDGITWNKPFELTGNDTWFTNDIAPQIVVFNNSLYAVWVSNNTMFNKLDDEDYDIVYMNTSDGNHWSVLQSINPNDNHIFTNKGDVDTRPFLINTSQALFCTWSSEASEYTTDTDFDIVLSYTTTGNFSNSNQIFEVTDKDADIYDHSPQLANFENRLYIIWASNIDRNTELSVRYFDLTTEKFGIIQKVNPDDNGGIDYWPQLAVFKNNLYSTWVSNDTTTTQGSDRDLMLTQMISSHLPIKCGLDFGGDGTWDIPLETPHAGSKTEFEFKSALDIILNNPIWIEQNSKTDYYGYPMAEIPIEIQFSNPGLIKIEDLEILYTCTFQVRDFSNLLNQFIEKNSDKATPNNTIIIPFSFKSNTLGKLKVSDIDIVFNQKPNIQIDEYPGTGTGIKVNQPVIRISWSDFDPDDDAMISLYFDTDTTGYDGELIVANLCENDPGDFYDWPWWNWKDELDLINGTYYVYANITDGRNFKRSYGMGPILLRNININRFFNITLIEPDGFEDEAWDVFEIEWHGYCQCKNSMISFYYDLDNSGYDGHQIDLNDDGIIDKFDFLVLNSSSDSGTFKWNTTSLTPGNEIFIYGKITDPLNISNYNYSLNSIKRVHMPAPGEFELLDDIDPNDQIWNTHSTKPKLTWQKPDTELQGEIEYELVIWEGQDKASGIKFELSTKDNVATIDNALDYNSTYFAEVFAQMEDGKRSMKSILIFSIINHAPKKPIIEIYPNVPKTASNLTCRIINHSFDEDDDSVEYTYRWFKNGQPQLNYDNISIIEPNSTTKGDTWQCQVRPYDQIDLGPYAVTKVIIGNTQPEIFIESPNTSEEYVEGKVIKFKFSVQDPDEGDLGKIKFNIFEDQPENKINSGYVQSTTGVVEFTAKLSKGTHNITFNITDGEESFEISLVVKVKSKSENGFNDMLLMTLYLILILMVILILVFAFQISRIRIMKKDLDKEDKKKDKKKIEEKNKNLEDEEIIEDEELLAEPTLMDLEEDDIDEEEPELCVQGAENGDEFDDELGDEFEE